MSDVLVLSDAYMAGEDAYKVQSFILCSVSCTSASVSLLAEVEGAELLVW